MESNVVVKVDVETIEDAGSHILLYSTRVCCMSYGTEPKSCMKNCREVREYVYLVRVRSEVRISVLLLPCGVPLLLRLIPSLYGNLYRARKESQSSSEDRIVSYRRSIICTSGAF